MEEKNYERFIEGEKYAPPEFTDGLEWKDRELSRKSILNQYK